jgi:hypothetical protein
VYLILWVRLKDLRYKIFYHRALVLEVRQGLGKGKRFQEQEFSPPHDFCSRQIISTYIHVGEEEKESLRYTEERQKLSKGLVRAKDNSFCRNNKMTGLNGWII